MTEQIKQRKTEHVNIYVNPTFLPDVIAKEYETLWTDTRRKRVIDAAVKNHVAIEITDLTAALGREPTVIREAGDPSERILALAASERVALVTLGSRGLHGMRALGSVSERVAHRAHCSVLVARPG